MPAIPDHFRRDESQMTRSTHDLPEYEAVLPMDPRVPKACTYSGAVSVLKSRDLTSATHVTDWELMGGTLMTIDGPDHSVRRRLEGELFKPGDSPHL